jgi:hypothetical protein
MLGSSARQISPIPDESPLDPEPFAGGTHAALRIDGLSPILLLLRLVEGIVDLPQSHRFFGIRQAVNCAKVRNRKLTQR